MLDGSGADQIVRNEKKNAFAEHLQFHRGVCSARDKNPQNTVPHSTKYWEPGIRNRVGPNTSRTIQPNIFIIIFKNNTTLYSIVDNVERIMVIVTRTFALAARSSKMSISERARHPFRDHRRNFINWMVNYPDKVRARVREMERIFVSGVGAVFWICWNAELRKEHWVWILMAFPFVRRQQSSSDRWMSTTKIQRRHFDAVPFCPRCLSRSLILA